MSSSRGDLEQELVITEDDIKWLQGRAQAIIDNYKSNQPLLGGNKYGAEMQVLEKAIHRSQVQLDVIENFPEAKWSKSDDDYCKNAFLELAGKIDEQFNKYYDPQKKDGIERVAKDHHFLRLLAVTLGEIKANYYDRYPLETPLASFEAISRLDITSKTLASYTGLIPPVRALAAAHKMEEPAEFDHGYRASAGAVRSGVSMFGSGSQSLFQPPPKESPYQSLPVPKGLDELLNRLIELKLAKPKDNKMQMGVRLRSLFETYSNNYQNFKNEKEIGEEIAVLLAIDKAFFNVRSDGKNTMDSIQLSLIGSAGDSSSAEVKAKLTSLVESLAPHSTDVKAKLNILVESLAPQEPPSPSQRTPK